LNTTEELKLHMTSVGKHQDSVLLFYRTKTSGVPPQIGLSNSNEPNPAKS